jgi:hypothetical protein
VAHLEVYGVISYLALPFAATLVLGYVFLLRRIHERQLLQGSFSLAGLAVPLLIILAAPVLDLILKQSVHLPYEEIGTTIGILFSLLLAIGVGRIGISDLADMVRQARPWRYVLIILTMFAFLNVFTTSGVPERIGALSLPPVLLCVVIGAALGMITGRIQAPMLILVPIYLSTQGAMSAPAFAVTFFAVFLGYLITPIHPCISVSLEYFDTPLGPFLRRLAVPTAVAWLVTLLVGIFVF